MYVYLSVENIMSNFRAIMVYDFHFGLVTLQKSSLKSTEHCKGHLNKALIDQNRVYS